MTRVSLAVLSVFAAADVTTSLAFAAEPALQTDIREMVVTAQRREQRLEDVPVSLTAIGERALEERNITDFQTYLQSVPGAAFADQGGQGNEVKLRGVGNGTSRLSPTTAVYLGDVPVIHTGRSVNGSYNFQIVDMNRIEVLRGPQGQLYGSNSLGGAIKNVPNQPTFNRVSGSASITGSQTQHAGGNYDVDATLNLPFSPEFAVRITGYDSKQSGWYKNVYAGGPRIGSIPPAFAPVPVVLTGGALPIPSPPLAGLNNNPAIANYSAPPNTSESNDVNIDGGRIIFAWKPSAIFDAQLMLAQEHQNQDGPGWAMAIPNNPGPNPGMSYVPGGTVLNLGLPGLIPRQLAYPYSTDPKKFEYANAAKIGSSDRISLANLVLNYDMGFAKLTSSTSSWERTQKLSTNIGFHSFFVTGVWDSFPIAVDRTDNPKTFVQEFRLTSPSTGPLTWLTGLFYSKIDQHYTTLTRDDSGLNIRYLGSWPRLPSTTVLTNQDFKYVDKQTAVFGEVAYDILPTVNAAFSFRQLWQEQTMSGNQVGFLFVGAGQDAFSHNDHKFLPKVNVSWKPSNGQMLYFTAAEGYRTGNVNTAVPLVGQQGCATNLAALGFGGSDRAGPTKPDTLWSYEIGAKMTLAEGVTLNASVYHIDWKDVQNGIILSGVVGGNSSCNSVQEINAGDAKIDGAEFELSARLTKSLSLDTSLSFTRPIYKDANSVLHISSGQTIDGTPKSQASLGLQYRLDLLGLPSWVRGEWNYIGRMENTSTDFATQTPPYTSGNYGEFNLRAGMDLNDNFSVTMFVTNLTDKFGVTRQTDIGSAGTPTLWTNRPRTIGATLRANF